MFQIFYNVNFFMWIFFFPQNNMWFFIRQFININKNIIIFDYRFCCPSGDEAAHGGRGGAALLQEGVISGGGGSVWGMGGHPRGHGQCQDAERCQAARCGEKEVSIFFVKKWVIRHTFLWLACAFWCTTYHIMWESHPYQMPWQRVLPLRGCAF